jgi:phosphate transport system permease protein
LPSLHNAPIGDRVYRAATAASAAVVPLLLLALAVQLGIAAWPAVRAFGLSFILGTEWDAVQGVYGAAPAVFGTVLSSAIAVVLAAPLAIGTAVFSAELAPAWLRGVLEFLLDLLAAVPSVIYGLWGLFVLVPWLRDTVTPFLTETMGLGALPFLAGPAFGPSMLAAGVLLAVMILPFIASVAREVLAAVPNAQREAALALGATRWEMIRRTVLPFARSGLVGAVALGLGRALGETMAVTMVIGNRHDISASLLAPGYTLAALIANEFAEASRGLHHSALMAAGAALLLVTLLINALARWLVWRVRRVGDSA